MPLLASAPVTWGVWEKTYGRDGLIEPKAMLAEVRELGFAGIELGPRGYFGSDAREVAETFAGTELDLVGAFVEMHLYDEARFRQDWDELEWTIPVLTGASGGDACVVLADAGSPERLAASGRVDEIARLQPSDAEVTGALARLDEVGRRCAAGGVRLAFHHHAGTHVETMAEMQRVVAGTDPDVVGFCIDSGHAHIGGIDPCELLELCRGRINLLHLKDVDDAVLARLRNIELDLEQAWAEGLFCECPTGGANVEALLDHPAVREFPGWLVFEQDRLDAGTEDLAAIAAVERRHLALVDRVLGSAQAQTQAQAQG